MDELLRLNRPDPGDGPAARAVKARMRAELAASESAGDLVDLPDNLVHFPGKVTTCGHRSRSSTNDLRALLPAAKWAARAVTRAAIHYAARATSRLERARDVTPFLWGCSCSHGRRLSFGSVRGLAHPPGCGGRATRHRIHYALGESLRGFGWGRRDSNPQSGQEAASKAAASTSLARARAVMGMPWADWRGLSQAIPPAYTEMGCCYGHLDSGDVAADLALIEERG